MGRVNQRPCDAHISFARIQLLHTHAFFKQCVCRNHVGARDASQSSNQTTTTQSNTRSKLKPTHDTNKNQRTTQTKPTHDTNKHQRTAQRTTHNNMFGCIEERLRITQTNARHKLKPTHDTNENQRTTQAQPTHDKNKHQRTAPRITNNNLVGCLSGCFAIWFLPTLFYIDFCMDLDFLYRNILQRLELVRVTLARCLYIYIYSIYIYSVVSVPYHL